MIVVGDIEHGKAIAQASGGFFNPEVDKVISRVTQQGNLMGGVIYEKYTGKSICMHVAGFHPQWLTRDMLWVLFDYPFNQLGCRVVFGGVAESNRKALEFDQKIGFKWHAVIKDVYPEGDLILLSMYKEDCRWLKIIKPRTLKAGG